MMCWALSTREESMSCLTFRDFLNIKFFKLKKPVVLFFSPNNINLRDLRDNLACHMIQNIIPKS